MSLLGWVQWRWLRWRHRRHPEQLVGAVLMRAALQATEQGQAWLLLGRELAAGLAPSTAIGRRLFLEDFPGWYGLSDTLADAGAFCQQRAVAGMKRAAELRRAAECAAVGRVPADAESFALYRSAMQEVLG